MTKPNMVSAYSCPYCNFTSVEESDITSCIIRHEDYKKKEEKINKINNYINYNIVDFFKRTLEPADPSVNISIIGNIGHTMIASASNFGLSLSIAKLTITNITEEKISFDISGTISKKERLSYPYEFLEQNHITKKEFLAVIKNNFYIDRMYNKDFSFYFSDFANVIGLDVVSGSGGENFSFQLSLKVKNFPKLVEEIKEYSILKERHEKFTSEAKRLKNLYERERLPSVLISDVNYAVMSSELDSLEQKKKNLLEEMQDLNLKINKRRLELSLEDSINIPQPDSSFDYDKERLQNLRKYYPSRF